MKKTSVSNVLNTKPGRNQQFRMAVIAKFICDAWMEKRFGNIVEAIVEFEHFNAPAKITYTVVQKSATINGYTFGPHFSDFARLQRLIHCHKSYHIPLRSMNGIPLMTLNGLCLRLMDDVITPQEMVHILDRYKAYYFDKKPLVSKYTYSLSGGRSDAEQILALPLPPIHQSIK